MNVTPEQRDQIARTLYVLSGGDSLATQSVYETLWDAGWVPSEVSEPFRVKAEDFIEKMGWVLTP